MLYTAKGSANTMDRNSSSKNQRRICSAAHPTEHRYLYPHPRTPSLRHKRIYEGVTCPAREDMLQGLVDRYEGAVMRDFHTIVRRSRRSLSVALSLIYRTRLSVSKIPADGASDENEVAPDNTWCEAAVGSTALRSTASTTLY